MTPARKAALQWFHDRGAVAKFTHSDPPPSYSMMRTMITSGQLIEGGSGLTLTDAGRRALHGDAK